MSICDDWEQLYEEKVVTPKEVITPKTKKINTDIITNNIPVITPKIIKPVYTPEEEKIREKIKNFNRRKEVDNKFCSDKIGYAKWNTIANSSTPEERKLYIALYELGKSEPVNMLKKICTINDKLYLELRNKCTFIKLENKKYTAEVEKKKVNKTQQIKDKLNEENVHKEFTVLSNLQNFELVLTFKFSELNILKMILYLQNNTSEELIVAYKKFLNLAKNTEINKYCLNDLEYAINTAAEKVKYNPETIISKNPKLMFKTKYDKICNTLKHCTYNLTTSQKEIMEWFKQTEAGLALVHSMLGSGKTSVVLPICGYLNSLYNNKRKVIYTCANDTIIVEVASMLYANSLPYAIVIYNIKNNSLDYKYTFFANGKEHKDRNCIILCDIYVARLLLEERKDIISQHQFYIKNNESIPVGVPEIPDYILIGDELTKGADSIKNFQCKEARFSIETELFVDLVKLAPKLTILMSATLPKYEQLKELYDSVSTNIKSFTTYESKVGTSLIDNNGNLFIPHLECKNKLELNSLIETVKSVPFIAKYYNYDVLVYLCNVYKKYGMQTPDMKVLLQDPSKANQEYIQALVFKMLEQLNDQLISEIKYPVLKVANSIKLESLLSTDFTKISKRNQICIIYTSTPIQTAIKNYKSNFGDDIFKQIKISKIIENYNKKREKHNEAIKRLEDKKDAIEENEIIKKNEKLCKLKDETVNWDFPGKYQLGSEAHANEYKYPFSGDMNIIPEHLPIKSIASDELITLLASGIGVYDTLNIDDDYLETVLLLAKRKLLKVLYSNNSIAYGNNLAVTDIIFNDTKEDGIHDLYSMNTIFQMQGRAARGGELSYKANVYTISDNLINKTKLYILGKLDEGDKDEIKNIQYAYNLLK